MTPENFCYWLQGWFELNQTIDHREGATQETLEMIKRHLDLVFIESPITHPKDNGPFVDNPVPEVPSYLEELIRIIRDSGRTGDPITRPFEPWDNSNPDHPGKWSIPPNYKRPDIIC